MELTKVEQKLVDMLEIENVRNIKRHSTLPCDIRFDCEMRGMNAGVWLPLAAISDLLVWTSPEIACMTDHPDMAYQGDWSGVRDSSKEAIWKIFYKFIVPMIEQFI